MRPAAGSGLVLAVALLSTLALRGPGDISAVAVEPRFDQSRIDLPFTAGGQIGAVEFGPDGRLYLGRASGGGEGSPYSILAITLDARGTRALATEEIASGLSYVLGLAFDPLAPPNAPVLYASHQRPDAGFYRGTVSTFSGPEWERRDVITGLPTGSMHMTNGLAFDEGGQLLIAQGQEGATPLSGAILIADVHDPSFDGDVTYSPPGVPQDNNVDLVSGDVGVFAPGLRNPYGVVAHSSGRIYATDNGGAGLASISCATSGGSAGNDDELNLIEEGLYYGHPNGNRGRFNPDECEYRSPKEPSEGRYRAPIAIMPPGSSCNGIAEYTSDAFNGQMKGDLLCAGFGTGDLRRAVISKDGLVERVEVLASDLVAGLDVAVRPDGTIYVGGSGLFVLSPLYRSAYQFQRTDVVLGAGPESSLPSIAFGPDGWLYAAEVRPLETTVMRMMLDESGTNVGDFDTVQSGLGPIQGIAFDPAAPPNAPVLYISTHDRDPEAYFQGRVQTLTPPEWTPSDVITGLPSLQDFTHGMAFDPSGRLLIAQGSNSVSGVWETPLSAAILVANVHDSTFDGNVTYDEPTEFDNTRNQTGGDVAVYAPGLTDPYDLLVHSNGRIYATDRGPAYSAFSSSSCTEDNPYDAPMTTNGELNLIEEGSYYGHPNRNRGRFDPTQCIYHSPQEPSSGTYRAPVEVFSTASVCNGIAEYTADAFGGEMTGDLLCAAADGTLRRIILTDNGTALEAIEYLADGLTGALDVAVREDGNIYVSGTDVVYVLSPAGIATPKPTPTPTPPPLVGDADCNFTVNAIDAALILQRSAGLIPGVGCAHEADVNSSGLIDAIDASLVLQFVAGLLDHLPP